MNLIAYLQEINQSISQRADESVAKFANNITALSVIMLTACIVIIASVANALVFLNILQASSLLAWIACSITVLFAPIVITWSVHIVRHASWYWYDRINEKLDDWL
ncbi:MAG: hypothetical protein KGI66_03610 [Patescibacteria group bacterium]|nr:hypothetical protein [Patescibacteria group bacterium]